MEKTIHVKQFLLKILDFIHYQVENDKCTLAEMQSFADMVVEHSNIDATVADMAQFLNKTENNVRVVANRTYPNWRHKPKRRVLYNFATFMKSMPSAWHKSKQQ